MTTFPGLGDKLPDIALTTPDGGSVKPSDFVGQKLVLFFYPKDDTPGCTTENQDFSALAADFASAGTALLGVSKDSPARHAKFIAKYALSAPLPAMPPKVACPMRWGYGPKRSTMAGLIWAWSAPRI
jgi:peroxiredoxin Q/BCP